MPLGKHLIQAVPFVYALQCLTGKVDNNTGKISPLADLSRFDHQVWRLAGIRVACNSSQALDQVGFFHCSTFIVLPHLLGQDLFRFLWLWVNTSYRLYLLCMPSRP